VIQQPRSSLSLPVERSSTASYKFRISCAILKMSVKTYYLAPNFTTAPPPAGAIKLGSIKPPGLHIPEIRKTICWERDWRKRPQVVECCKRRDLNRDPESGNSRHLDLNGETSSDLSKRRLYRYARLVLKNITQGSDDLIVCGETSLDLESKQSRTTT
jgi:hypothetical protein